MSSKSVLPERSAIVSSKGVLPECHFSVSSQGVPQVGSLEIVTISIKPLFRNIRVGIRVRGLHLVFLTLQQVFVGFFSFDICLMHFFVDLKFLKCCFKSCSFMFPMKNIVGSMLS